MNTKFRWLLVIVLFSGIVVIIINHDYLDFSRIQTWVQSVGVYGPIMFVVFYAIGALLFFPGSVLTLASGALFGPWLGTLYSLAGATIGATLSFLLARYLAFDWVTAKAGPRLRRLSKGVDDSGWRFIAFVRLVPLFPFNLLNYTLGLTRIKLSHYVVASFVCMLPGAFAYTFLGYVGSEAVSGETSLTYLVQISSIALALLATVMFLPSLLGKLRMQPLLSVHTLKQKLSRSKDLLVLDVRSEDEFVGEQGHIACARNIPLEQLAKRFNEITNYIEKPIVLVCKTDIRSAKAAQFLVKQGFTNVSVIRGGMTNWLKMGYENGV